MSLKMIKRILFAAILVAYFTSNTTISGDLRFKTDTTYISDNTDKTDSTDSTNSTDKTENTDKNDETEYIKQFDGNYDLWQSKLAEIRLKISNRIPNLNNFGYSKSITNNIMRLPFDYLYLPAEKSPRNLIVINSGIHGIEAAAGVVFQQIFLDKYFNFDRGQTAVLIIYVMNTSGAKSGRRVNSKNIDLNRNCFDFDASLKSGFPGSRLENIEYKELQNFFENPVSQISIIWRAIVAGETKITKALRGQYQNPRGIYYGGMQVQEECMFAEQLISQYLKTAKNILIVDIHTGLGKKGINQIMINPINTKISKSAYNQSIKDLKILFPSDECEGLCELIGVDITSKNSKSDPIHQFTTSGDFTQWIYDRYPSLINQGHVLSFTSEIGTVSGRNAIEGLINENYCYWHQLECTNSGYQRELNNLRMIFNPSEIEWQRQVIKAGYQMQKALKRFSKF